MTFTDKEITWACRRVLLDELDYSKTLKESLSLDEKDKFRYFVKSLKMEQIIHIFEQGFKPLTDDDFIDPRTKKSSELPSKADFDRLKKSIDDQTIDKIHDRGETLVKVALAKKFGLKKIAISVGIATLLAIIGYLLYRRYRDKCKQLCFNSTDKDGCMKKCKVGNTRNIIKTLSIEKSKCGANQKCNMKFEKKMRNWEEKLRSIKY